MDQQQARALARRLEDHPNTENAELIGKVRGVVTRVLAQRVPRPAAIVIDENDKPVVVGVGTVERAVVRLRVTGSGEEDFKVESELIRLDHPAVKCTVFEDQVRDDFRGKVRIAREWRYDLGDGRNLRLRDEESNDESREEHAALEAALAAAAGWPVARPDS
jgi:hypothetical protein